MRPELTAGEILVIVADQHGCWPMSDDLAYSVSVLTASTLIEGDVLASVSPTKIATRELLSRTREVARWFFGPEEHRLAVEVATWAAAA